MIIGCDLGPPETELHEGVLHRLSGDLLVTGYDREGPHEMVPMGTVEGLRRGVDHTPRTRGPFPALPTQILLRNHRVHVQRGPPLSLSNTLIASI